MKKEIIQKIETLLKEEDISSVASQIRELRTQYNEAVAKQEAEGRQKFLEEGGEEADYVPVHDEEDKKFAELMAAYNKRKKEKDKEIARQESENLAIKEQLIIDLKQLISEETHIAKAYQGLKEIREKWDQTGNVPKDKFKEIQHEFSLQLEYFYYNINIYKTLKEYDLEKNLQIKQELIGKMEALLKIDSIKEVREQVEVLIAEWDATGPTFKEKWQEVRDRFWEAAAQVHRKIREHFSAQKEKQKANLDAKTELCEQVERINETEITTEKGWRKKTKEVLDIQEKWKTIGFAVKKQNEKIWQRFRAALDEFFGKKKAFFGELKGEYSENEKQKLELISQAEKLKDSTDWRDATDAFKKLQRKWKNIGHTGVQRESRLWKQFNSTCNAFFAAKKHYYDTLDDRLAEHFDQKEAIVQKVRDYELTGEQKKDIEQLNRLAAEWNAIGMVARDKKEVAQKSLNDAMNAQYAKMKLDPAEKEKVLFSSRIEGMKKADNAPELLQRERIKIKERIRRLEAEVVQYENNLGFFESASGENPLMKQAEQKVEVAREALQKLKDQLRQVPYPS